MTATLGRYTTPHRPRLFIFKLGPVRPMWGGARHKRGAVPALCEGPTGLGGVRPRRSLEARRLKSRLLTLVHIKDSSLQRRRVIIQQTGPRSPEASLQVEIQASVTS